MRDDRVRDARDARPARRSTARRTRTATPPPGWFRYATTNPGHLQRQLRHARPGERRLVARRRHQPPRRYSQSVTGLTAGDDLLLLRHRLRTRSGTAFGAVMTLITLATPTVTTAAATGVSSTAATLNGQATPNGGATTGWFRDHH